MIFTDISKSFLVKKRELLENLLGARRKLCSLSNKILKLRCRTVFRYLCLYVMRSHTESYPSLKLEMSKDFRWQQLLHCSVILSIFFQQAYASDGKRCTLMTALILHPPHNRFACDALSSKTPPMLKYNALTVPYTHWLVGSSPCFCSPSSLWQKGFKANDFQLHTGQFFKREEKRWCHLQRCKDRNFCGLLNINTWISATETKAIIKANNPR